MIDLVALSLEVNETTLASGDAYRAAIDHAATAIPTGGDARVVVFPELAGHLALYALAPVRRGKTLSAALGSAAVRRPLDVLRGVATGRVLDPRHAVMVALAPDGERFWRAVFGPLAKRHAAWVVAGSHLRLSPAGELTNASMLFDPDGRLVATTDKVNLLPGFEDGSFIHLARGNAARVPVVDTPAGKLATLIGYDAFAEPHTPHERFEPVAERLQVDVVANPSAHVLPIGEGWPRDGLHASLAQRAFAHYGVVAHLVGRVLDLAFDGVSQVIVRDRDGVRVLGPTARV